jgi:ribosomal-protein-alanine N-acetyltransferase
LQGPPTIETQRLLLRAPEPADAGDLFEIQGNPDAMRYTYCAASREATTHYLERYAARFSEDGYAPWTVILRSEDRIVGWGGLNRDPDAPHWGTEVSYFIHPSYWGRGLATELVRASLGLAFGSLGLAEVLAYSRPENRASHQVLRKAGFVWIRYVPELERDQYRVAAGI